MLAGRIGALVDRLGAAMPAGEEGFAPIHGNLFGDQILHDPAAERGRRVGFVDWDAWCHGDPHFDLGRLMAHAVYAGRLGGRSGGSVAAATGAVLAGYRQASGWDAVDRARLAWHMAAALLLRAKISSLRKLAPGWPRHVALMVEEAEHVIEGSRQPLHPRPRHARAAAHRPLEHAVP
jgi:aminoglycoside phosphotransferase (APT) family kinase protein